MARIRSRGALWRLVWNHARTRWLRESGELREDRMRARQTRISRREFLRRSGALGAGFALGGPVALTRAACAVVQEPRLAKAGLDPLEQRAITPLGSAIGSKLPLLFDQRYWSTTGPRDLSDGDPAADVGFRDAWDLLRGQPSATRLPVGHTGGNVAGSYNPSIPPSITATNPGVTTYAKVFREGLEIAFPGMRSLRTSKGTLERAIPAVRVGLCLFADAGGNGEISPAAHHVAGTALVG